MSNLIIPQFFGSVLYWTNILSSNVISLKREVAFQKSSRMNRTEIMTANGLLLLTVPVIGGRNTRLPYSEIMIDFPFKIPFNIFCGFPKGKTIF